MVSLKYDAVHPANIREVWSTFAAEESNIAAIVDFLLKIGDKKRNADFMTIAKQILQLIARTQPSATVGALVNGAWWVLLLFLPLNSPSQSSLR